MWGNHPEWWENDTPASTPPKEPVIIFKNYNPDMNPSASAVITGVVNGRCVRVWEIRGLGVLCMEMTGDQATGRLSGDGLGIFSKEAIHDVHSCLP